MMGNKEKTFVVYRKLEKMGDVLVNEFGACKLRKQETSSPCIYLISFFPHFPSTNH